MNAAVLRPASWPISLKIPLVVAVLVIAIGAIVTERVLSKLSSIQDQNLRDLSGAYLDGLSTSVLPHVLRQDIWEVFDAIERSRSRFGNINIVSTVVAGPDDIILAASDPGELPTGTPLPKAHLDAAIPNDRVAIRADHPTLHVIRNLEFQGQPVGEMMVTLDVSRQLAERRSLRLTLIATIIGLTLLMAVIGYLLTRRMTRPMQVLAEHLDRGKDGRFSEISAADTGNSSKEVAALFDSYNSMVRAVNERDVLAATLHEEEKLAGLGRLAAAMAHEINNPLGGMLNVLETLKRHEATPEIRKKSINMLERGLKSIGDVVQTALAAYRSRSRKRDLSARDFADLRHLLRPEIHRRAQVLTWQVSWHDTQPIDGTSVRQIALNLLLNASKAAGRGGQVGFRSTVGEKGLCICVDNSGAGFPPELLECLNDSSSAKKVPLDDATGLGLWVICRLVQDMKGQLSARNRQDGAAVTVTLPLNTGAARHAA